MDLNQVALHMRRGRSNLEEAPAMDSRASSEGLNGTPRAVLARLDSLSAYSTERRLAEYARASGRPTPVSTTSTSVELATLAPTSSGLHNVLSSLTKKPPPPKDPVPFMRLAAEIRIKIYEYTWTVVDCPWKLAIRAGQRDDGDRFATGIEYWLGPAFRTQVQYPKIVMSMDPRIKKEFVDEICVRYPVQMRISGHFTELIPSLSIHRPSIFLEILRECQIQYFPHFLSNPNHVINPSENWKVLRTDLATIVKLSLLFPSLELLMIHIPIDFTVLLTDEVPPPKVTKVIYTVIREEVRRKTERKRLCFSVWKEESFIVGWHVNTLTISNGVPGFYSRCTALNPIKHDPEHCTSASCRCIVLATTLHQAVTTARSSGLRFLTRAAQWATVYREGFIALAAFSTTVLRVWPYSGSFAILLDLDKWRTESLTTFARLLLESLRTDAILHSVRRIWRDRNLFYALIPHLAHHLQQYLATVMGDVPLSPGSPAALCIAEFGRRLDRTVSLIIEFAIGILFEAFLHVICWIAYGLCSAMPPAISYLTQDWRSDELFSHVPGIGTLQDLTNFLYAKLSAGCFTGPRKILGIPSCKFYVICVLWYLSLLFAFHTVKKTWSTATHLAGLHRTQIASACRNAQRDLCDLWWTIRTVGYWLIRKVLQLSSLR